MMREVLMRHKTIIIIIAVFFIAAIGFAAGLLAKTSIANNSSDIGFDAAKEIALASVGVSVDKATFTKESIDDSAYEIEFFTESNDYEFEINKNTGAIIDRQVSPRESPFSNNSPEPSNEVAVAPSEPASKESETAAGPSSTAPTSTKTNDNDVIGVDAAKNIALSHAGLSNVSFQEASLDYDDGVRVYDLEFISGNKTYDYEINAYTGDIISYDIDALDYDD